MNYEQRYKDAFDRAKKLKETCDSTAVIGWCEYIFPELKESEDEAIRESLIKYLKERKSCESYGQYVLRYDHWITWLEKQGEQKPADKVEPKFKVGDWVAINSELRFASPLYIKDIDKSNYRVESLDGNSGAPTIDYLDNHYHLWTIEDAKDGDVLCLGDVITIFKKYIGQEKCICYCSFWDNYYCSSCDNGGFEIPIENGEDNVYGCTSTAPATKEQRGLLFQKMKESGYEWDANKKELKKL